MENAISTHGCKSIYPQDEGATWAVNNLLPIYDHEIYFAGVIRYQAVFITSKAGLLFKCAIDYGSRRSIAK